MVIMVFQPLNVIVKRKASSKNKKQQDRDHPTSLGGRVPVVEIHRCFILKSIEIILNQIISYQTIRVIYGRLYHSLMNVHDAWWKI